MVAIISPPASAPTSVDVTQKKLGTSVPLSTTLVANTAAPIVAADATATMGRKINSITNTSNSATVFVALGRPATASNYDFTLYPGYQILDMEWDASLVSAISTGTPTVVTNVSKYEEI